MAILLQPVLATVLRASAVVAALALPASAETVQHGQAFGDWTVHCTSKPDPECTLSIALVRTSDNTRVLQAQVAKEIAEGPSLLISVPWGVWLPGGLVVQVDDRRAKKYQFEYCDPGGCHPRRVDFIKAPLARTRPAYRELSGSDSNQRAIAIPMQGRVLREFKKGLKALMQFLDREKNPVTIEISLIGFTKGFEGI